MTTVLGFPSIARNQPTLIPMIDVSTKLYLCLPLFTHSPTNIVFSPPTQCIILVLSLQLELDRYLREHPELVNEDGTLTRPSHQAVMGEGKMVILKAGLDLWTIASGLFVIIFILSRSKLRSSYTNWLIVNAVFVCLLNAVLVDPILIDIRQNPVDSWRFGSLYCYMLFGGPADVLGAMIPLTLIVVIIERLIYIRSPGRQGKNVSLASTITMIIVPWAIISVITVFVVYVFKTPKYITTQDGSPQCTLELENNMLAKVTFAAWFGLSLAIPIVLMNILAMVSVGSVCCAKIETSGEDAITEKKEKRAVKQAALLVTVMTVVFTVAAIPSAVAYVTTHTSSDSPISFEIVVILQMAFRAVEPLMWLLLASDLRSAVYDLLCGWREDSRKRDEQTRLIKVTNSPTRTLE